MWEPVIHALTLYKKTIYSYAVKRCRELNRLDAIEGQFFLHLNPEGEFVRFKEDGAAHFTSWFEECAVKFFVLPDEALELEIEVNPQHLRGICMDWFFSLGLDSTLKCNRLLFEKDRLRSSKAKRLTWACIEPLDDMLNFRIGNSPKITAL